MNGPKDRIPTSRVVNYSKELLDERDELLTALDKRYTHGFHVMRSRVDEWLKHVEEEHPHDYQRTRSYYFLKRENPPEGMNVDRDDFPGLDSAKTLFANIRREFLGPKE